MQGIILAAGMGKRLKNLTRGNTFVRKYHGILPEIGTDTEGVLYRVSLDGRKIVLIKAN